MIRATTNGVLKSYRSNLNRSALSLNAARNAVLTERNYNSYAEDPATAAHSFQLRRSFLRTSSQYTQSSTVLHKFETAFQAMEKVVGLVDNEHNDSSYAAVLRGANDPTGSGRSALSQDIFQLADSIVQAVNGARYGSDFMFAGADGLNVPLEWSGAGASRVLTYRGIPVDAGGPVVELDDAGNPVPVNEYGQSAAEADLSSDYYALADGGTILITDYNGMDAADRPAVKEENGNPVEVNRDGYDPAKAGAFDYYKLKPGGDVITQDEYDTQKAEGKKQLDQLKYLSNDEAKYVDIGLGLKEHDNSNELITSSAYNIALQATDYLGYGFDEDGDPKNIVSILQRMGTLLQNCGEDGRWANPETDGDEYSRLARKLKTASDGLHSEHVKLSAQVTFLDSNHDQLKDTANTLNEQFLELDQIDLADAITAFSWAQYCYNAALKMGNSILGQSLMDYMN